MIINFTPIQSLIGGMLIGISASTLVLATGKIAGISGIIGSLIQFDASAKDQKLWRFLFLLGLMSSSYVYVIFDPLPTVKITDSYTSLIIAGLLVGFGSRMGSGCTSGHGVCGLSRFSPRSLVATFTFMFAGFITCYSILHLI